MKSNKKGFTLSEILVALAVIGVIMALSVQTLKVVRASYSSLTYFAYKNVKNIIQEASSGTHSTDGEYSITTTLCRQQGQGKVTAILNPDKDLPVNLIQPSCDSRQMYGNNKANFCLFVTSIINMAGEARCNYADLYDVEINPTNNEPFIATNKAGDFNNEIPTFTTTNGQKYYLSKHTHNNNVSLQYGFRLLAIDLNGKSNPNISDVQPSIKVPDIVTFLILDNGEIYPLGVAADNIEMSDGRIVQYINAKIKGYYYDGAYYDGAVKNLDRERSNIPEACFATVSSGQEAQNQLCNFATVHLKNPNRGDGSSTFFSYRQAYCGALGNNMPTYTDYCNGISKTAHGDDGQLCPPSNSPKQFDLCTLETIKPAFRYEMK